MKSCSLLVGVLLAAWCAFVGTTDVRAQQASVRNTSGGLPPRPPIAGNWRLTLDENFEGPLNPRIWMDRELWDDASLGVSLFESSNISVRDGKLIITTIRKPGKNKRGDEFAFSSGLIQSFGKFAQAYGYFEARMAMPEAKGLWPAFWLMPDRGKGDIARWWLNGRRSTYIQTGVNNGFTGKGMEIDIMEHLTIWGPNKFHAAIHWDGYGKDHKKVEKTFDVPPSPDGWRIFGLHWRPNLLVWFVDNKEVYRIENDRVADVPMYILLNTSVGGWHGNHPDPDTKLPATTAVDWVRVWAED